VKVEQLHAPEVATGFKLAANNDEQDRAVLDKDGFARRWLFSRRYIDALLAQGLPHCKLGARRVRIITGEADNWMRERFGTQRRGRAKRQPTAPSTQPQEASV
jgi:hypothetical protein